MLIEYVEMLYGLGIELEILALGDSRRAVSEALRRDLSVYDGSYIALANIARDQGDNGR